MDYVKQNGIVVEGEKDYSTVTAPPMVDETYGIDILTQYYIYKDSVIDPMSYGEFMNICGPYWEEDWKTLWLKELYNWFNIFSIVVMGCYAINNVQIPKININIPKINWGGMANTGYGTIYISPSISMTTASAWAVDIAGMPSILLEQITYAMTNNGISGSPTSSGGEGAGSKINIDDVQFGKKIGKHAQDYGLDPKDANARTFLKNKINDIFSKATEVRQGDWRGLGGKLPNGANASGEAKFYIQGKDVVVTDLNGEFVTIMKDGINNPRVMSATKILP